MAASVQLGYPLWADGMEWTSLLSRQLGGGAAVWDSNASAAAVNPLGGVIGGMKITQTASPSMAVLVGAGYVAVPHLTQGHGVYLFGLLAQGTLTVSANSSGQTRIDLIIARVNDLGTSGSTCDVEIVAGTPGSGQPATPGTSVLLATITVASGASSITNANITDKRTFTVAPGGLLPVASAGAAPPLSAGEVVWNTGLSALERLTDPVEIVHEFTEAGTYSLPVPANTISTKLEGEAAGGAGGGSTDDASGANGGGGGEGGEWDDFPCSPSDTLTIVVGGGGTGSPPGEDISTAGGDTTVTDGSSVFHLHGGQPGKADAQGGLGGTGSTAPVHNDGGRGGRGSADLNAGGGGGSSGSPSFAGLPGGDGNDGLGGLGAPALADGGPGGNGGGFGSDGQSPYTGPGGGSGGSPGTGNSSDDAADGQLTVTFTVRPSPLTALASAGTGISDVDTSTGTAGSSGLTPGSGSSFGWGIGYGSTVFTGGGFFGFGSGFDADGATVPQIQVEFDADGSTDFQLDAKWGLVVAEAALDSSSPSIANGRCRVILMIDSTVLDSVWLLCAASGGVNRPGDAGSFTYYTSASRGTTPAAGTHIATLAIQTKNTLSGQLSGAHIGNLASTSTSSHGFGSVPGGFTSALTAENCYLRVSGILASAI